MKMNNNKLTRLSQEVKNPTRLSQGIKKPTRLSHGIKKTFLNISYSTEIYKYTIKNQTKATRHLFGI